MTEEVGGVHLSARGGDLVLVRSSGVILLQGLSGLVFCP